MHMTARRGEDRRGIEGSPSDSCKRADAHEAFPPTRRRAVVGGAVSYAILGLIAGCDAGAHGYQLKLDCDSRYRELWTFSFGQLYRILDRLEREGLISGTAHVQATRPTRRVYRITPSGRQALDQWLSLPPSDEIPSLPDELSVRLLFLSHRREEAAAVIQNQRATDRNLLARLTRRRSLLEKSRDTSLMERLLLLQGDMRLRAEMAWLDLVEQALVQREDADAAAQEPEPVPRESKPSVDRDNGRLAATAPNLQRRTTATSVTHGSPRR